VPEDLEGVKLRIYEVETLRKAWEAFGAVPIVITWSEAYLALRQGVADAITCPIGLLYTARFTEILKYVTITKQFPQTMIFGMNTQMFEKLSKAEQKIMIDAVNETGGFFSELERKRGEEGIQKMLKEHNAFFIQTNLEPWWEKGQSARKKLEASGYLPKGLWEKVNEMK
jgi:TRAP-type C4-dicarboxylate transport system substrate-binding protein